MRGKMAEDPELVEGTEQETHEDCERQGANAAQNEADFAGTHVRNDLSLQRSSNAPT
jgi:hypothetical protein